MTRPRLDAMVDVRRVAITDHALDRAARMPALRGLLRTAAQRACEKHGDLSASSRVALAELNRVLGPLPVRLRGGAR